MSGPLAFRASYADWKLVKTRGVVQVVFEVPLHDSQAAYDVLGGMPQPSKEHWFAIAAIRNPEAIPGASDPQPDPISQPRPDRAKRDFRDLPPSQQAALRCNEPIFQAFLKEEYPDEWHEAVDAADCVRMICNVSSRAFLDQPANHTNRMIWHALDSQYQAWKAVERVGA